VRHGVVTFVSVCLAIVVTIFAYGTVANPITHADVINRLDTIERMVAENTCLALRRDIGPAVIAECQGVDPSE
jgi:hypothetical protein